jgi:hypothetical protein
MRLNAKLALLATQTVLVSVCIMPFLIFLSVNQDIDMQAALLILLGVLAWVAVLITNLLYKIVWPNIVKYSFYTYCVICILSLIDHASLINLYGSVLLRLGSLELLASVGCGILLSRVPSKKLMLWLYIVSVTAAVISVPYTYFSFHFFIRLGGIFHQADILAAWLACGFILGCGLWSYYNKRHILIGISQLLLLVALFLTQTRAVMAILVLLLIIMAIRNVKTRKRRIVYLSSIAVLLLMIAIIGHQILPNRLANTPTSIVYRLRLQSYGVKSSFNEPLLGFGAGNVSQSLSCQSFKDAELVHTCSQGYYFDSSHDIYLDRILALGYIGGIAFVTFVVCSIYRALRLPDQQQYFGYTALLLGLYYLTNVTNIEIEVLLWILMFRAYRVHTVHVDKDNLKLKHT